MPRDRHPISSIGTTSQAKVTLPFPKRSGYLSPKGQATFPPKGQAGRVTLPVGLVSYPLGASAPLPLSQGESLRSTARRDASPHHGRAPCLRGRVCDGTAVTRDALVRRCGRVAPRRDRGGWVQRSRGAVTLPRRLLAFINCQANKYDIIHGNNFKKRNTPWI